MDVGGAVPPEVHEHDALFQGGCEAPGQGESRGRELGVPVDMGPAHTAHRCGRLVLHARLPAEDGALDLEGRLGHLLPRPLRPRQPVQRPKHRHASRGRASHRARGRAVRSNCQHAVRPRRGEAQRERGLNEHVLSLKLARLGRGPGGGGRLPEGGDSVYGVCPRGGGGGGDGGLHPRGDSEAQARALLREPRVRPAPKVQDADGGAGADAARAALHLAGAALN
mmetsp:Transcript_3640/g.11748  ORF Transcript_3640/g.11748 Transcript_3640/m.11748 type:complete len:224 (-) Transcript_3640:25-696(-)